MSKLISFLLAAVMVVSLLPATAVAEAVPHTEEPQTVSAFAGKTLSILGDSISTMSGVSNDTSANSTIGKNSVYYTGSRPLMFWTWSC